MACPTIHGCSDHGVCYSWMFCSLTGDWIAQLSVFVPATQLTGQSNSDNNNYYAFEHVLDTLVMGHVVPERETLLRCQYRTGID